MKKIKDSQITLIYLAVVLLVMGFVELLQSVNVTLGLQVFYIPFNKGLLIFAFTTLFFCWTVASRRLVIDGPIIAMAVYCVVSIVPIVIYRRYLEDNFLYQFSMTAMMPMTYYIFRNYRGQMKCIVHLLTAFALITFVQVVLTVFRNGYPFSSEDYKLYMRIPLAHSNMIAAIILSLLLMRVWMLKATISNSLINMLLIVELLLIQSRATYILLFGWLFVLLFANRLIKKKYRQAMTLLVLPLAAVVILLLSPALQTAILGMPLSQGFSAEKFTSGRLELFAGAFEKWKEHIWLGRGLTVVQYPSAESIVSSGSHNVFLDTMVYSGLFGLASYITVLAICLVSRPWRKKDSESQGILLAIASLLVYSMFDVVYNNYSALFLLWMFMGLYNNENMLGFSGNKIEYRKWFNGILS